MTALATISSRVGAGFHQTFSLNRPEMTRVLALAARPDAPNTNKGFQETLRLEGLGPNHVRAAIGYATGSGLLAADTLRPTELGQAVLDNDPDLNLPVTLWMMHLMLSAPAGPGPVFWAALARQAVSPGAHTARERLMAVLNGLGSTDGKPADAESARATVTVFTGSYTKPDGLGPLRLLSQTEDGVQATDVFGAAPKALVGLGLAHLWDSIYPGRKTIDLDSLFEPGSLGSLLLYSDFQLQAALRDLQRAGRLELWRVAPPYQAVRGWESGQMFIDELYAQAEP